MKKGLKNPPFLTRRCHGHCVATMINVVLQKIKEKSNKVVY